MKKVFNVEIEVEENCIYAEVSYANMQECEFQEYAYTYADSLADAYTFIADRIKMFTEKE